MEKFTQYVIDLEDKYNNKYPTVPKKKLFEDAWKIRSDFEDEDFNLKTRSDNARKQITKLQEEAEKLKEKRPALLTNKDK